MEEQSLGSRKKMANAEDKTQFGCRHIISGIDDLGDDIIQNIINRLPALCFASAACVSRSWNSLCNSILSTSPKLSSAVSFNRSLEKVFGVLLSGMHVYLNAVNEVVDKVLSEPIRPHFVLASIGPHFSLQAALQRIGSKFGFRVPVIVNVSEGVIGKDVCSDQFVEVQWEVTEDQEAHGAISPEDTVNWGIILTVGFLPALKAHIVPLLFQHKGPRRLLIDEFVMDVREVALAVSDSTSPAGIIMFANKRGLGFRISILVLGVLNQTSPLSVYLAIIALFSSYGIGITEYAFPEDTFVVGDGSSQFLYRSNNRSNNTRSPDSTCAAVALIFTRDRNKPLGIGETQFHVMLSTGISPVGYTYKAVSVKCNKSSTWLTASRETAGEHLDGQTILEEIYDELGDRILYPTFYVGVTKRRRCSVGMERVRKMQFLEFHEVLGGDEQYLFVNSVGITTAEPFRFYISDSKAALSSCDKVSDDLRHLKLDCDGSNNHVSGGINYSDRRKVFGGIIFSCCGRGESFFGRRGVDSAAFLNNFPGVTFGGTYCAGEIGRGKSSLHDRDNEEGDVVCCSEHVYSAVYLVMSYSPPQPE
ncbi:F-box/LRR-repeat protein at5g63520 [Phtheirospermum japonicum]|uniref:F-box/LRR-repeat protein at5g63520 n=1 Tax=Phtheirospermum japonicum TaxID=374723 RepID=A0A830BFR4_9LAMI|nr:F-box/LRR-repeat protein at5g63520 [Phtheirospermum japonicum]